MKAIVILLLLFVFSFIVVEAQENNVEVGVVSDGLGVNIILPAPLVNTSGGGGGGAGGGNTTTEIQNAVGTGAGGGSGGFGEGLTYQAPWFNHSDTSNQSDSTNSGNTFIQSLGLDKFGHLISIVIGFVEALNPFDQDLNTTSLVVFAEVNSTGEIIVNNFNVSLAIANSMGSGLVDGGFVTIGTDPAKFDISATKSWFVNNSNPVPNLRYIECPAFDEVTITNLLTAPRTDVALLSDCTLEQKTGPYSNAERRSRIVLGRVVHANNINITVTVDLQHYALGVYDQYLDLTHAIGNINPLGNIYSAAASDLTINRSSGTIFRIGANYVNTRDNPNEVSQNAEGTVEFVYRYRDGIGGFIQTPFPEITDIDVDAYDDGSGTLASVPNNRFSIQRIYLFSDNATVLQYGQEIYNKLSEATAAISTEVFIADPNLELDAVLRGWIVVKGSTTDLSDTDDTKIINAGKFGSLGGGTGTSAAQEVDLQNAYDNSDEPEIILTAANNGFTIRDAATPILKSLFEIQNNDGTINYFNVSINGTFENNSRVCTLLNGLCNSSETLNDSGLIINWSNVLNSSGYIIDWNSSGYIIDWNSTGFIRDWQTEMNGSGFIKNYNATGLIQNYNATNLILNWSNFPQNETGLILNWSDILNGSGLIQDWNATSLIINWNDTGYIIDWNWTGFIRDWQSEMNGSGFIQNYNITGLILNWSNILNDSGYIIDWNATGLITRDRSEANNTFYGEVQFKNGSVISNNSDTSGTIIAVGNGPSNYATSELWSNGSSPFKWQWAHRAQEGFRNQLQLWHFNSADWVKMFSMNSQGNAVFGTTIHNATRLSIDGALNATGNITALNFSSLNDFCIVSGKCLSETIDNSSGLVTKDRRENNNTFNGNTTFNGNMTLMGDGFNITFPTGNFIQIKDVSLKGFLPSSINFPSISGKGSGVGVFLIDDMYIYDGDIGGVGDGIGAFCFPNDLGNTLCFNNNQSVGFPFLNISGSIPYTISHSPTTTVIFRGILKAEGLTIIKNLTGTSQQDWLYQPEMHNHTGVAGEGVAIPHNLTYQPTQNLDIVYFNTSPRARRVSVSFDVMPIGGTALAYFQSPQGVNQSQLGSSIVKTTHYPQGSMVVQPGDNYTIVSDIAGSGTISIFKWTEVDE